MRDAFRARGHDAWSCDPLPCEKGPEFHFRTTVQQLFRNWKLWDAPREIHWDMMLAFPPCTHLAVSGARWFKEKEAEQAKALKFVRWLMASRIPRIAIENPIGVISSQIRKPDQIIQPWQFGHGEVKATCLWLKGLPPLKPTDVVEGRHARVHRAPPSPDRWKERSRTLPGIAQAMAVQWEPPFTIPAEVPWLKCAT